MSVLIDLTGRCVGKLTVIRRDGFELIGSAGSKQTYWACRCDCGRWTRVAGFNLRSHHTLSCGCLNSDVQQDRARREGKRKGPPRKDKRGRRKGPRAPWLT